MSVARNLIKTMDYSPQFRPKSESFEFGKQGYHVTEHRKGSRMAKISAS